MHLTRNLVNFELMVVTEGNAFYRGRTPLLRSPSWRISSFASDRPSARLEKRKLRFSTGSILSLVSPPHQIDHRSFWTRPPDRFWMSFMLHRHPPTALRTSLPPSFHPTTPKRYASQAPGNAFVPEPRHHPHEAAPGHFLRFHNTFLNNSLTAAVLGEINCQSPFYRTYTSETQRTQILQDIIATSNTTAASPSKSPNSPVISATTTNTSPPSSTRAPG